jgi:hypothetical protein
MDGWRRELWVAGRAILFLVVVAVLLELLTHIEAVAEALLGINR